VFGMRTIGLYRYREPFGVGAECRGPLGVALV